MERVNNAVLVILHLIGLLFGFFFLSTVPSDRHKACDLFYFSPFDCAAHLIITLSLVGLCKFCCSARVMRWLYLLAMLAIILEIACKLGVGVLVFSTGSDNVDNPMIKPQIRDFSPWLQYFVDSRWPNIKSCLLLTDICAGIAYDNIYKSDDNPDAKSFVNRLLYYSSFIQRGCCIPPPACGLVRRNGTDDYYARLDHFETAAQAPTPAPALAPALAPAPAPAPAADYINEMDDCNIWDNKELLRCFECETCKVGFMAQLVLSWKGNFVLEAGLLTSLILIFAISIRATFSHNGDHYHEDEESCCEGPVIVMPGIIIEERYCPRQNKL